MTKAQIDRIDPLTRRQKIEPHAGVPSERRLHNALQIKATTKGASLTIWSRTK